MRKIRKFRIKKVICEGRQSTFQTEEEKNFLGFKWWHTLSFEIYEGMTEHDAILVSYPREFSTSKEAEKWITKELKPPLQCLSLIIKEMTI